jgi:hypothetical protein
VRDLGREIDALRVGVVSAGCQRRTAQSYAHAPSLHWHPQLQFIESIPIRPVSAREGRTL